MTAPYLGKAIVPANTDLDYLAMIAQNANTNATTALANAAAALAALNIVPVPAYGRLTTTLQAYINHTQTLWAGDYGVVGDGVADDTVAMNYALAQAAAAQRILYCGNMVVKITAALSGGGGCPGLVFDQAAYGNAADPGIFVTGAGYTALTWHGSPQAWSVNIYGTANACDGLVLGIAGGANIARGVLLNTRVYNLAGFGVQINKCYDCLFGSISIELCGMAAKAAFQMNDDGDTCNMTHICRLQVEQATTLAIDISPNSLALVIDSIHSERLISPDAAAYAWVLGGASSSFNASRFQSGGTSANAKLWLRGSVTDYTAVRAEGNINVYLEGVAGTTLSLISPNINGTCQEYGGQTGQLMIFGGLINAWTGSISNRYWFHTSNSILADRDPNTLLGDLKLGTAGKALFIKQGTDGSCGRATLVPTAGGGVVTVACARVITNAQEIFLSYAGVADPTHTGRLWINAVTDGVSFQIKSSNALDESDVSYLIVFRG